MPSCRDAFNGGGSAQRGDQAGTDRQPRGRAPGTRPRLVGEDPWDTATREIEEELGIHAKVSAEPLFLTVTETVGIDAGHTDVSLWYVVEIPRDQHLRPDAAEFHSIRWWSRDEIGKSDPALFDPHLNRFLRKLPNAERGR
ncbi:NUDIX hydrolase [Actinoplanes sp. NPDC023801]|uniref:NUDIX hydrolase n=1 Tax=Actinoplanes sp. NPDC023801 TaxID=3154595 RepID=UPI0033E30CF7